MSDTPQSEDKFCLQPQNPRDKHSIFPLCCYTGTSWTHATKTRESAANLSRGFSCISVLCTFSCQRLLLNIRGIPRTRDMRVVRGVLPHFLFDSWYDKTPFCVTTAAVVTLLSITTIVKVKASVQSWITTSFKRKIGLCHQNRKWVLVKCPVITAFVQQRKRVYWTEWGDWRDHWLDCVGHLYAGLPAAASVIIM